MCLRRSENDPFVKAIQMMLLVLTSGRRLEVSFNSLVVEKREVQMEAIRILSLILP